MQWKHRREEHNRQDKVKKPDYREAFLAESNYDATPLNLESFKGILLFKSELIRRYEQGVYLLDDKYLQLNWSWKEYAQVNKLEMTPVNPFLLTQSFVKEEDFSWREAITKLVTEKNNRFSTQKLNISQQFLRVHVKRVFLAHLPSLSKSTFLMGRQ